VHAHSQLSEAFAREMAEARQTHLSTAKGDAGLSSADVEEWLRLFKGGR